MIPKLEQKILIFGFTITQGIVLVLISLVYLMAFNLIMEALGFIGAVAVGIFIVATPAVIFKTMLSVPDNFIQNWIYFHFIKPDIYLPGRENKSEKY